MNAFKCVRSLVIGVVICGVATAFAASPKVITYQGRLTDAGGNAVADGVYSVTFRLYDAPTSGTLLWTEPGVSVTTEKGLFTTNLGSPTPFPSGAYNFYNGPEDIFQHAPALWLEIQVSATILTPRTLLQSVPHAITASNLGGRSASIPGVGIESSSEFGIIQNLGNDSLSRFWIAGNNWGQLILTDGTAANEVNLAANYGGGGSLELGNGVGGTGISLYGGSTGDLSVNVPADAIDSKEILDEPGIAIAKRTISLSLSPSSTSQDFVSVTITIPAAGYIIVDGNAYLFQGGGPTCFAWVQISETSGAALGGNYCWTGSTYTGNTTGYNYQTQPVKITVYKGAPGTYTFYLQGNAYIGNSGGVSVYDYAPTWLQATYFPTSYGSVASLAAQPPADNPEVQAVTVTDPQTKQTSTSYNVDLRYYELQAKKAEAEALRAELNLQKARAAAGAPSSSAQSSGALNKINNQK
jgi:hypothetical protein